MPLPRSSFGKVFKARNEETSQLAAVKIVPVESDTGEVTREIDTLKQCSSPNIVQYFGSTTRDGELWILMEFCAGSSLADIMEARGRCLNEAQIAAAIAGTLAGLSYLHNRTPNLIHRDVKAGNLLLASSGVVKLADFGVSAQIGSTLSKRGTVIGTPFWMAPEVISGGPTAGYNTKADVWSLGITAIELAEGQPPNSDMHPMRAIFLIPTRPPPTLTGPHTWSADFVAFVHACLQHQVPARSSTAELMSHPFALVGQQAQEGGVLDQLMGASLEPLREWRMKAANEAAARAAAAGFGHGDGTQEINLGTLTPGAAGDGTMVVKGGDAGTMVVNGSSTVSRNDGTTVVHGTVVRNDGTTVVHGGGDGGTMLFRGGSSDASGTTVIKGGGTVDITDGASGGDAMPAFMRQFQPPTASTNAPADVSDPSPTPAAHQPATPPPVASRRAPVPNAIGAGGVAWTVATPDVCTPVCTPAGESDQALAASERRSSSVSEAGTVAAAGASVGAAPSGGAAAACGSTAGAGGQKTPAKFDFNSLSIAELDEELANQEANFQRDVGKLRKQYERRGRALRSARASKSEGSTSSGPAVDAAEAAANAALAAAAAARR